MLIYEYLSHQQWMTASVDTHTHTHRLQKKKSVELSDTEMSP